MSSSCGPSTSDYNFKSIAADRIRKELQEMKWNPKPEIFAIADYADIRLIHALIIGHAATPYQGGFFYFVIQCLDSYPSTPPKVKLMTTSNETIKFNPNIYSDGTVCMSILNTLDGIPWTPALTISTLLLSIQTLLNQEPYLNEPGDEGSEDCEECTKCFIQDYNNVIQHETIRVAVCEMLEDSNQDTRRLPDELRKIMQQTFVVNYTNYVENVRKMLHLNGHEMKDPFWEFHRKFDFDKLIKRLQIIYDKFTNSKGNTDKKMCIQK